MIHWISERSHDASREIRLDCSEPALRGTPMDPEAFQKLSVLAAVLTAIASGLATFSPNPLTGSLAAAITLGFGIYAAVIQASWCAGFQAVIDCLTGLCVGVMLGLGFRTMEFLGWAAWLIIVVVLLLAVSLGLQFYVDTKNFLNGTFGCTL